MEAFGAQILARGSQKTRYLERQREACVRPAGCRHARMYPGLKLLPIESVIPW